MVSSILRLIKQPLFIDEDGDIMPFDESLEQSAQLQRIILFGILVDIVIYNEDRLQVVLPALTLYLKNWVPFISVGSPEFFAVLSYTGSIIECAFKFDFHVLNLFNLFISLPQVDVVCNEISRELSGVITTVADFMDDNSEMWLLLENIINSLIMSGDHKNKEILKTIDYIFNNHEINRFIPNDFTSTLCLLINNIYLHNAEVGDSRKQQMDEEVFSCYISVINYCYVIYNNIWSAFETQMEKNEFDFNRSELQSLVRVVTLVCKDRHKETIKEGLKCLHTMFNDNRMQLLDVKDWIDLIQLLLFPTVKDTINNLMNIDHVIELPRGRKFSSSLILQTIIELLKEVIMSRLRDLVYESSFPPLWITYCSLVELIHNISEPASDLCELNRLTAFSLIQTLNALEWFSNVYKGQSLQVVTLNTMRNFSKDANLQQCFVSGDDEIAAAGDGMENRYIDEIDQYYNDKKIIDRMGAGKEETPNGKISIAGTLPFLSSPEQRPAILSPHADTLEIDDLEDIESVASEQSN